MRILDFHTHPWRPGDLAPGTRSFIERISPAVRAWGDRLGDPRFAASLLRQQGVEHAVLLPEHCPATSGNVRTESVLAAAAHSDGFFLPFASVDINSDDDAAGLLERYLDAGARGLKLYPSYQFYYPDDARLLPLYALCQERRVPVLLHIGSSVIPGTRMRFCDPILLDDVAVAFPDLMIVMAHGGRGLWYDVCSFLALHHANVWIDVAGLVPAQLPALFPRLDRLAAKMVFGSDWPAMPKSAGENAAVIASLGLDPAVLEALLFGNAAQILRMTGT
jgi:uncharacterized protein